MHIYSSSQTMATVNINGADKCFLSVFPRHKNPPRMQRCPRQRPILNRHPHFPGSIALPGNGNRPNEDRLPPIWQIPDPACVPRRILLCPDWLSGFDDDSCRVPNNQQKPADAAAEETIQNRDARSANIPFLVYGFRTIHTIGKSFSRLPGITAFCQVSRQDGSTPGHRQLWGPATGL